MTELSPDPPLSLRTAGDAGARRKPIGPSAVIGTDVAASFSIWRLVSGDLEERGLADGHDAEETGYFPHTDAEMIVFVPGTETTSRQKSSDDFTRARTRAQTRRA